MSASITSGQREQILRLMEDGLDEMGLSKDDAQELLRQGGKFQNAVRDALREFSAVLTWRTVKLGTIPNMEDLRKAFAKGGVEVSQGADDILQNIQVVSEETELKLARVTFRELGFPEGARYKDVCARIKELGHRLCPAEVGPQLRLQYKDQPRGEWLTIVMEPVSASNGGVSVFVVGSGGAGLWLGTGWSYPDGLWDFDHTFVFVLGE